MDSAQISAFLGISRSAARLGDTLARAAEILHDQSDLTPAQRLILEQLIDAGPQAVPTLARARSVSRQNCQTLVDALVVQGLAIAEPNPAHKRSPLIVVTSDGRRLMARMRSLEAHALAQLRIGIAEDDLKTAAQVMTALANRFDDPSWSDITQSVRDRETESG